ncbi:MAG: ABC transporter permease [Bacteroidetes bacterium GWE2_29_8]|nr:MAG: ABC transporter permease [Bacteroidetes bacterium GWE2_29_8]OFY18994.1 MAG: ABC transporter permease [Bacteroidetes bacterium GWF2_29_10]
MNKTFIIAQKELNLFFNSLIAYIILSAFLGFNGFFTWISGFDIFYLNQASLKHFFDIAYWSLFLFIPALTMRSIAEERKNGTIEILLTKSVNEWNIIFGKLLSNFVLIAIALILTIPYYLTVSYLGNIDHPTVICGYLGLLLISIFYISIGIFASSVNENQVVAFLISIFIGIFFHLIFDILASTTNSSISKLFYFLSVNNHFSSINRGVIDSRDIIFFISFSFIFLNLAYINLIKRK